MSAPEATTPPKPKGKKMIIIIAAVVLLAVAGGGGWFMFGRHSAEDGEEAPQAHAPSKPKTPPVFLPVDNMVVNLADPGGDRYAQIGVTIETVDQKTSDEVKAYMPTVRSAILMLVSQRTSEELLTKEGKDKLAKEILREVSKPLGYTVEDEDEDHAEEKPRAKSQRRARPAGPPNPINNILFTSFIVQ